MKNQETLKIACCTSCNAYTLPANAYGCRVCGQDPSGLEVVELPTHPVLVNFITVHAALSPELEVPCVIGEVEFAPGLVEEAVLSVSDEAVLRAGMQLVPRLSKTKTDQDLWVFEPVNAQGGEIV